MRTRETSVRESARGSSEALMVEVEKNVSWVRVLSILSTTAMRFFW